MEAAPKPWSGISARQVWKGPEVDSNGSLTPDGRWMALTHWNSGDLVVRDMSTGQMRRLDLKISWEQTADFAKHPVFSADQHDIAYTWYRDEDCRYELRIVAREPGSRPRVLVRDPEFAYVEPDGWSLDGRILATVRRRDGRAELVWISSSDGTVKVLRSLERRNPSHVELSPDGRYIAFDVLQEQIGPDRDIYTLAADGSSESVLVQGPLHDAEPCWTPDGSHIVFISNRSGRTDLWSVAVREGRPQGDPRKVKADVGERVRTKRFTNSNELYYVQGQSDEDVFAVEIDPTGRPRAPKVQLADTHVGHNRSGAWSPDGRWIAFQSLRGHSGLGPGGPTLVVRSLETGEEHAFWTKVQTLNRPTWFHHGLALLRGEDDLQGRTMFYRIDVRSEKLEPLRSTGVRFTPAIALAADDRTVYGPVFTGQIVRFDLWTGEEKLVYTPPDGSRVTGLALSPDARTLAVLLRTMTPGLLPWAYEGDRDRPQVCVVSVDGADFRRLAVAPEGEGFVPSHGLAWSADGRLVYFVRTKEGVDSELWRVPAAGGAAEYTGLAAPDLRQLNLSPDGSLLTYTEGRREAYAELWVLRNLLPALKASH
jgi:Tol biopolymer transport system component